MANQLLSDFIHTLAKQSGVDVTSEDFKLFMSDQRLVDFNIDDKFTKQIQESHLTFESAKNNSELQKHFVGSTLSGIDNAVKRALKNSGASPEVMKILDGEGTTLQKTESVINKIFEESKKPQDNPDTERIVEENKNYVKKINELQEEVSSFPGKLQKVESELKETHQQTLSKYKIHGKLSGYKFNTTIPIDEIYDLVDIKLGKLPYVIREKDGELKVFQKDSPELEAMKDNKTVTLTDVLDTVVSPFIDKGDSTPAPQGKTDAPAPKITPYSSLEDRMKSSASGGLKPAQMKE